MAAVVLGVATVTFATGLATTMTRYGDAGKGAYDVSVYARNDVNGKQVLPVHGDRELQSMLGSLPGAAGVTARGDEDAQLAGSTQKVWIEGRRGPDLPLTYHVKLREDADPTVYARAARAVDRGLSTELPGPDSTTRTINGSAAALTLMLALVASLGVFDTAVLNTHDRRRDLGLKSIGMTPRQVTVMTVTSMAVLGAIGSVLGIPLGIAAYEVVVPRMAAGIDVALPSYMTDVWQAPKPAAPALAGLVIAVLGALVPARRAARLTVAEVLHSE